MSALAYSTDRAGCVSHPTPTRRCTHVGHIAALSTIHNHCTFMERIARVLSEPASTFRLSSFDFCGIISTNLKKLDEQIKSGVA